MDPWAELPRTQVDPQTINEAIDSAITTHNEDPEAHLGVDEALEVHRDNDVIDHPEKSVVNDKIAVNAREYVAIVDPSSDVDYDTIESAITYAITEGGGNILITPGTHYLSDIITLPRNINLIGTDPDTCIVETDGDTDEIFSFQDVDTFPSVRQLISNLTFSNNTGGVFTCDGDIDSNNSSVYIDNCLFVGGGTYFVQTPDNLTLSDCKFEVDNDFSLLVSARVTAIRSQFNRLGSENNCRAFGYDSTHGGDAQLTLTDCRFVSAFGTNNAWLGTDYWTRLDLYGTIMFYADLDSLDCDLLQINACEIEPSATSYLQVNGTYCRIVGNRINSGTGNRIRLTSSSVECIVIGNIVGTAITNSGTDNVVANNVV